MPGASHLAILIFSTCFFHFWNSLKLMKLQTELDFTHSTPINYHYQIQHDLYRTQQVVYSDLP